MSTNSSDTITACRVTAETARKSAEYVVPATTAADDRPPVARSPPPATSADTQSGRAPATMVADQATTHLLIATACRLTGLESR